MLTAVALVPLVALGWWALHPPPSWSPPAGLRASFLDVGQGDGILLETPEGAVLVDAGPPEARVDRQLRRMGLHTLAAIVVTHAHRDHVGGAPAVLRSLRVGEVIDPLQPGQGLDERAMRQSGPPPRRAARPRARWGGPTRSGACGFASSGPTMPARRARTPTSTARSCSRATARSTCFSPATPSPTVTRSLPLRRVEVLKVAHHGSSDPGLADELGVLRPRVAVISVGAHNDYGHPRADTLAALHGRPGLAVYRTDEHGRVVLESDGRSLTVRTERGGVR